VNDLALVLPLCAAMLLGVSWVAWEYQQPAGYWWSAAGLTLLVAGVLSQIGPTVPADGAHWGRALGFEASPSSTLPQISVAGNVLGPLAAWLLYRGAASFVRVPPRAWPGLLAVLATLAWVGFWLQGRVGLSLISGYAAELPLCLLAAAQVVRRAQTRVEVWLGVGIGLFSLVAALDPFLAIRMPTYHVSPLVLWSGSAGPVALLMAVALLERRLRTTHEHLQQRDQELLLAQDAGRIGSWSLDVDTGHVEWSAAKFRIYGYEPGAFEPTARRQIDLIRAKDVDRVARALAGAIEDGAAFDIEFGFSHADGSERFGRTRAARRTLPDGRRRVVGVTIDITHERHARDALAAYRERLEELVEERSRDLELSRARLRTAERLASLGTLSAGVAHQVNNPVASIVALAQYTRAQRGAQDEIEALRRALDTVEEEAKRCGEIVRGMLRFASDDPQEKSRQPLDEILSHALSDTAAYAEASGISLGFEHTGPSPLVVASAIELEQAVVNLLRNAVEAGSTSGRVELVRELHGSRVRVHVRDDGRGMSAKEAERSRDPFYTSRLGEGGTGLGLSVAHGIAVDHGGSLRVDSRPGAGTTVTMELPRVVTAAPARSPGDAAHA